MIPKVVDMLAVPWEEQAQKRAIWSVDEAPLCGDLVAQSRGRLLEL